MKISTQPIANQQHHGDTVFPYAMICSDPGTMESAEQWTADYRDELLRLTETHGAVLLRGLPVKDAVGFDRIIQALRLENFPYQKSLSNAVRINRTERVFSANEAPSEVRIFFHHEMAQTPIFPKWIMFSCEVAPREGGATPLCRSDVLYQRLAEACPTFVESCQRLGLKYTNVMPGEDDAASGMGRSWSSTLGVDNRTAAQARLAELNYTWEWLDNGCLRATTPVLPAVKEIAPGRRVFFNQLIAAYCGWKDERNDPSKAIRHGDDSILDRDAVQVASELAEELTFDMHWQVGDVVLIDNTVVMHARKPFVGERKVVASLAEMHTQSFAPIPSR